MSHVSDDKLVNHGKIGSQRLELLTVHRTCGLLCNTQLQLLTTLHDLPIQLEQLLWLDSMQGECLGSS